MVKILINKYWFKQVLIFILALLVLFFRRPDALLIPQFWAEDGKHWFGEAYQNGALKSLSLTYAGSPQLMMRLIGTVSIFLPLSVAPLLFTSSAIFVQILPILLIHSKRYQRVFKDKFILWCITFAYLLMPNAIETHANLTNIGWHMALVSFLIIIGPATNKTFWKYFDIFFLAIGSLTGPFALLMSVPAFITYRKFRKPHQLRNLSILIVASLIQIMLLILGEASKRGSSLSNLDASLSLFVQIIGKRIFGVTFLGNQISLQPMNKILIIVFFLSGVVITIYTLIRASFYLRVFVLFCWLVLIATLLSPAMGGSWQVQLDSINDRYWYLPSLAFLVSLIWLSVEPTANIVFETLARIFLIIVLFVGVTASFFYTPLLDRGFNENARKFDSLASGEKMCIKVNPDDGWLTCITKK